MKAGNSTRLIITAVSLLLGVTVGLVLSPAEGLAKQSAQSRTVSNFALTGVSQWAPPDPSYSISPETDGIEASGAGLHLMPLAVPVHNAYLPGRILIKFSHKTTTEVQNVMDDMNLQPFDHLGELDIYVVSVPPGDEMGTAARLSAHPAVAYAEPDYLLYALTTPNDPYYQGYQWNLIHINADDAWNTTTGSSGITIAVLDTGVDLGHPDLVDKIVSGYDFVNGDGDPADDHGHGTHVASIAAAASDNGVGVAGVSWGAKIMPVKVLGADGAGTVSGVADGICWAADQGADIINLSLGGPSPATLQVAVNYAHDAGVLLVASAGNEYEKGNPLMYPAACDHVLAVAATDDLDGHASYSSSGSYVDVAAPGGNPSGSGDTVPEHWIIGAYWRGGGYDYAWGAGTSQAAPHVAGLAALLLSANSSLTNDEMETLIRDTAVDVITPGWDEFTGDGRIDVNAAVATAGIYLSSSYTLTKQLNTAEPVRVGASVSFTIRITNTGDSWIGVLPLRDVYSTTYLAYGYGGQYADPESDDKQDDGVVEWSDLTVSWGQDLAPGASFSVVVTFTAQADTTDPYLPPDGETVNTAIVQDAFADPDGPGPLGAETPVPPHQDNDGVTITVPTGVVLETVNGVALPDGVVITWQTAGELGILGFNVLRSEAVGANGRSPVLRVNEEFIFAEYAGSDQGTSYDFRDEEVVSGITYDYVLEVVQSDGRVGRQGRASVSMGWWLRLPLVM